MTTNGLFGILPCTWFDSCAWENEILPRKYGPSFLIFGRSYNTYWSQQDNKWYQNLSYTYYLTKLTENWKWVNMTYLCMDNIVDISKYLTVYDIIRTLIPVCKNMQNLLVGRRADEAKRIHCLVENTDDRYIFNPIEDTVIKDQSHSIFRVYNRNYYKFQESIRKNFIDGIIEYHQDYNHTASSIFWLVKRSLSYSCQAGDLTTVKYVIDNYLNRTVEVCMTEDKLNLSQEYGSYGRTKSKYYINLQDIYTPVLLMDACIHGKLEVINYLLGFKPSDIGIMDWINTVNNPEIPHIQDEYICKALSYISDGNILNTILTKVLHEFKFELGEVIYYPNTYGYKLCDNIYRCHNILLRNGITVDYDILMSISVGYGHKDLMLLSMDYGGEVVTYHICSNFEDFKTRLELGEYDVCSDMLDNIPGFRNELPYDRWLELSRNGHPDIGDIFSNLYSLTTDTNLTLIIHVKTLFNMYDMGLYDLILWTNNMYEIEDINWDLQFCYKTYGSIRTLTNDQNILQERVLLNDLEHIQYLRLVLSVKNTILAMLDSKIIYLLETFVYTTYTEFMLYIRYIQFTDEHYETLYYRLLTGGIQDMTVDHVNRDIDSIQFNNSIGEFTIPILVNRLSLTDDPTMIVIILNFIKRSKCNSVELLDICYKRLVELYNRNNHYNSYVIAISIFLSLGYTRYANELNGLIMS
jgi:hypothetical protein